MTTKLAGGTVHAMPADFKEAIFSNKAVLALWEDITPLARNEWICWVISGKKAETRSIRIKKALSKMKGGMRRPCCWIGCIHRADKPISKSVQWALSGNK
jgi:uncharacterized protein YdeI (YjbR/CyaY-like superfamily)